MIFSAFRAFKGLNPAQALGGRWGGQRWGTKRFTKKKQIWAMFARSWVSNKNVF